MRHLLYLFLILLLHMFDLPLHLHNHPIPLLHQLTLHLVPFLQLLYLLLPQREQVIQPPLLPLDLRRLIRTLFIILRLSPLQILHPLLHVLNVQSHLLLYPDMSPDVPLQFLNDFLEDSGSKTLGIMHCAHA